ncbi:hypothetical protein ACFLV7_03705 [Chloroflexota bacterium]
MRSSRGGGSMLRFMSLREMPAQPSLHLTAFGVGKRALKSHLGSGYHFARNQNGSR